MDNLKEKILHKVKSFFSNDLKRKNHALKVTKFAEMILGAEPEANRNIVIASALLHDIGILEAEKKYNSCSGKYQEIEGPPIAKSILKKMNLDDSFIDSVCEIVGNHHSPGNVDSVEFKIILDSDLLVNISDQCDLGDKDKLKDLIDKAFNTEKGKAIAYNQFLT